ncbi:hypothetical protein ACC691_40985, partial [Rhizobium johnstonii]|uniref:hypothetical protein n=1 Tax=Rhizobium johnstonii TaxID=3019933 RepID=UPI003F9BAB66
YVSDQVVAAIEDQIDIDGLTNQVFDGVEGLGLPAARPTDRLDGRRDQRLDGLGRRLGANLRDLVLQFGVLLGEPVDLVA